MKKFLNRAFIALFVVAGLAFTACDDDDDNNPGTLAYYGDDYVQINGDRLTINEREPVRGSYDATNGAGWFAIPVVTLENGSVKKSTYKFSFTSPEQLKLGDDLATLFLTMQLEGASEGALSYVSGSAVVVDVDYDRNPNDQDFEILFTNLKMGTGDVSYTFNGKVDIEYYF